MAYLSDLELPDPSATTRKVRRRAWFATIALGLLCIVPLSLPATRTYADDPTFGTRRLFGSANNISPAVAVGDVDGDGDLDLITSNSDSESPSVVYLNDGASHFATGPITCGVTTGVRCLGTEMGLTLSEVADVDGDGDLDIVAVGFDYFTGILQNWLYLNDGAGNFPASRTFGSQEEFSSIAAMGDVDGDGDLDILVGTNSGQSKVYLNVGFGNFPTGYPVGPQEGLSGNVAFGDMNGDGRLDIIVGKELAQSAVYLNNGTGHYASGAITCGVTVGVRCFGSENDRTLRILVGDMDGDGDNDLVAVGFDYFNQIVHNRLYLNDGAANFSTSRSFGSATDRFSDIALADADGDGDLDLVTSVYAEQNKVYLNDGAGNFPTNLAFGSGTDNTTSLAVGDVDGDGDLDLVTVNSSQQNIVYLNDGAGTFTSGRTPGSGMDNTQSLAVGDVDGDGDLDLVAGNDREQNVVYLNNGSGQYASGLITCGVTVGVRCFGTGTGRTWSVAVGDVDGDGDLDLVAGNYMGQNAVYVNDGLGHFASGIITCGVTAGVRCFGSGADHTFTVATGDVDGDGDLDLAVGNDGDQSAVYLNDGSGHFAGGTIACDVTASVRCFGSGADHIRSVALGDMDGDGDLDLVAGHYAGQSAVYLNNGTGRFASGAITCGVTAGVRCFGRAEGYILSLAVGDVDSDRDLDIITNSILYLNDGASRFASGTITCDTASVRCFGLRRVRPPISPTSPSALTASDMDRDGDLDIVDGSFDGPSAVYLNDGTGHFAIDTGESYGCELAGVRCLGGVSRTQSVAVGDLDGDNDLDIFMGTGEGEQSAVYLNDGSSHFASNYLDCDDSAAVRCFGPGAAIPGMVLGDMDGDGDLDLVTGTYRIYFNQGLGTFDSGRTFGNTTNNSSIVAIGDIDGDHDLDIIAINYSGQGVVYLNDGVGRFARGAFTCGVTPSVRCFGKEYSSLYALTVGDVDRDGDLDLITGSFELPQMIFLNDGAGHFAYGETITCGVTPNLRCFGTNDSVWSLALGDVDGDSDLDLIAGGSNVVFLNDGAGYFGARRTFGGPAYTRVAAGDIDGDGDLDILAGNDRQQNVAYLNDGAGNFPTGRFFGTGTDATQSVIAADMDGDGDLDLVTGNASEQDVVYVNDGAGTFSSGRTFGTGRAITGAVVAGDLDGDGDLDLITGNNMIYLNRLVGSDRQGNSLPHISVARPGPTLNADGLSTPAILDSQLISITYTLADPDGDPVRFIRAFYSLDGGGHWLEAKAALGTKTTNLGAPPNGERHTYVWDVFASKFFGQSDEVVFRILAYPDLHPQRNGVAGPYQRPYASATTFAFRVRGTQVQVLLPEASGQPKQPTGRYRSFLPIFARNASAGSPIILTSPANALIYRLPAGELRGASPLASNTGQPFRTDQLGYLQGHGALSKDDRLIALLPARVTESYTLYYTNASPTATGVSAYTVTKPGVQAITVSSDKPLLLFNLKISLEWDARYDKQFLSQLEFDLKRASEFLYDWTNGQVALGNITIYQDKQHWNDAHIRIYATNRLRPNANQGGIVTRQINDPLRPDITYVAGQLRIGAIWNRYGETNGALGEDWPRTLAHELGHYTLFLDDNYIGLDGNGILVPVTSCSGTAMSDPYRDDYSEFRPAADWLPACAATLSNQNTGRADWTTIGLFYPWLKPPAGNLASLNPGPSLLPLEVTQIKIVDPDPVHPTDALAVPIFLLSRAEDQSRYQPGGSARAFLFKRASGANSPIVALVDLGEPTLDQVLARGARPGDRVCVYEQAAKRLGCQEAISPTNQQLPMASVDWQPDLTVTPVTSTTIAISVANVPNLHGRALKARLFPAAAGPTTEQSLTLVGTSRYTGSFKTSATTPAFEGFVQIWVDESTMPRRELVADYIMSGNPGSAWGRRAPRGNPGSAWGRRAPVLSSDGQVILFGRDLDFAEGQFFALQTTTSIPTPPSWATVIGQSYRLTANRSIPASTSISFSYLGREVPPGEEPGLRVYFWNTTTQTWEILPTVQNSAQNNASARIRGAGLYVLMSSIEIELVNGVNYFAYPLRESRPVRDALRSIDGFYTLVRGYDPVTNTWKVFDPKAPDYANTLKVLEYGKGYEIHVTKNVVLRLKGDGQATTISQALQASDAPAAPATYYGTVLASPGFVPTAGMPVIARINDIACGTGQTLSVGGQVVYSVNVFADGSEGAAGCGALGRAVTFQVGPHIMQTTTAWNNDRMWGIQLE